MCVFLVWLEARIVASDANCVTGADSRIASLLLSSLHTMPRCRMTAQSSTNQVERHHRNVGGQPTRFSFAVYDSSTIKAARALWPHIDVSWFDALVGPQRKPCEIGSVGYGGNQSAGTLGSSLDPAQIFGPTANLFSEMPDRDPLNSQTPGSRKMRQASRSKASGFPLIIPKLEWQRPG